MFVFVNALSSARKNVRTVNLYICFLGFEENIPLFLILDFLKNKPAQVNHIPWRVGEGVLKNNKILEKDCRQPQNTSTVDWVFNHGSRYDTYLFIRKGQNITDSLNSLKSKKEDNE